MDQLAVEHALAELARPTLTDVEVFLTRHVLEEQNGVPVVAGVVLNDEGVHDVYLRVEDQFYFLVLMLRFEDRTPSLLGCRIEAGSTVYLRVSSEQLSAEDITARIGLIPSKSTSKGEISSRTGRPYPGSDWSLCPAGNGLKDPGEVETKFTRLLDATQEVAEHIKALASTTCTVHVTVAYYGYAQQMWGLALTPWHLERLAALGATLDVDLYAS